MQVTLGRKLKKTAKQDLVIWWLVKGQWGRYSGNYYRP